MNNLLDIAKKYLGMGFSIIPVGRDKKPLISWKEFQERKPTIEELEGWFSNPSVTGIAIITGRISGVIVLDTEEGADITGLEIPKTPTAISGGGGIHYYFKYSEKENIINNVRFLPLMDIRSEGGYIVVPPSLHPSGNSYAWLENFGIDEVEIAETPEWLLKAMSQKKSGATEKNWPELLEGVAEGQRNDTAASITGKLLFSFPANQWEYMAWPLLKNWNLKNNPPLEENELRSVFESIAKKQAEDIKDTTEQEGKGTQTQDLIALVKEKNIELFHDQYNEAHAMFKDNFKIIKLSSKLFSRWLSSIAWKEMKTPLNQSILTSVTNVLSGEACFGGEMRKLHVRVAWHEGCIWYDLGDGKAVRISKDGWEIIENPPILFYRFNHQKPQTHPQKGGDVSKLLEFLNLKDKNEQLLFLVAVICCLIPDIAHPILVSHGPQGSAKSMLHKLLKNLIDPSQIDLLSPPDNLREFVQTASHHWIINLDNLSYLQAWLSDALCKVCTGSSFSKRELFTNDDDIIYSFKHVVGLNGINLVISKADLLERSILLAHEPIDNSNRKEEALIISEFESAKPFILGSIFGILSAALKEEPNVKLKAMPRMADFTHWGFAVAKAMGNKEKDFLDAYKANILQQHDEVIDASLIGTVIMELMKDKEEFAENATNLLEELNRTAAILRIDTKSKAWPKNANKVWGKVNEIKINLKAKGINADREHSGGRKIVLRKIK